MPNEERLLVAKLIENRGADLATVSRAIGKNHAYLHQYLKANKPLHLPERVRAAIARYFGVDQRELGAPVWRPPHLDRLLFPLHCQQCGADFNVPLRGLVAREAISCPSCRSTINLKKLQPAIKDLARVAATLDNLDDEPD